jgi:hypothetical protein
MFEGAGWPREASARGLDALSRIGLAVVFCGIRGRFFAEKKFQLDN